MRKPFDTKQRWALGIGLLAIVLIVLMGASTVLGSSQTTRDVATPESQVQAPPPLTGYQQAVGPVLSDEKIAELARAQAASAGDEAQTMSAVDTTMKSAMEIDEDVHMTSSTPEMAELEKSEVVVVTLHGQFTLTNAPVPNGHSAPTGSLLTLVIDAHTGWIDARELTNTPSPGIAALGAPRTLGLGHEAE